MEYFFYAFSLMMALILFLTGYRFYHSHGKASQYIAGFNTKSEEERRQYDESKLCRDYGKRIMLWSVPFLLGPALGLINLPIGAMVETAGFTALLGWHIWDMHENGETKYRK